MNEKKLSLICALASSVTLSGCASLSAPEEVVIESAEPFSSYDLSQSVKPHSTAMQYLNLVSRERVHKANDLDQYMDGYTNVSARTTQLTAVAGTLASAINPFQAAFSIIGQQSNLSKLDAQYKTNTIFIITPISSLDVKSVSQTMDSSKTKLVNIISQAYRDDGSKPIVIKDALASDWSRFPSSYIIPVTADRDVVDCYYPDTLNEIEAAVSSEGHTVHYSLPANGSQGCFSDIYPYGYIYTSSADNGWGLPSGDFLVQYANLPALFPIDKLSSSDPGVYLYQPAFSFMEDKNIRNYKSNDKLDDIKGRFKEEGIFRLTPMVTDLNNRENLNLGF